MVPRKAKNSSGARKLDAIPFALQAERTGRVPKHVFICFIPTKAVFILDPLNATVRQASGKRYKSYYITYLVHVHSIR